MTTTNDGAEERGLATEVQERAQTQAGQPEDGAAVEVATRPASCLEINRALFDDDDRIAPLVLDIEVLAAGLHGDDPELERLRQRASQEAEVALHQG
jgi:hypothetical protein